jgi:hypothetical protein
MLYLDRKAEEIAALAVPILREELAPLGFEVSDAGGDSPTCSERHDRGAWVLVSKDREPFADFRVEIPSAEGYDGTAEGWGFGFGCVAVGGRVGPGSALYNFTEHVWTRDRDEMRNRLAILRESVDEYAYVSARWIAELGPDEN